MKFLGVTIVAFVALAVQFSEATVGTIVGLKTGLKGGLKNKLPLGLLGLGGHGGVGGLGLGCPLMGLSLNPSPCCQPCSPCQQQCAPSLPALPSIDKGK